MNVKIECTFIFTIDKYTTLKIILILLPIVDITIHFCSGYTIYNEKYFSDGHFSYIVCVIT